MIKFIKLCRDVTVGDCIGIHNCGDFTEGTPGSYGQPQCGNLMGVRKIKVIAMLVGS